MMEITEVSPQCAKEMGIEVRSMAAGPKDVRIELQLAAKGEFKSFSRVDLELRDGAKLLISAPLREEGDRPGRISVSFAADRTLLDKLVLRVVTSVPALGGTGYELHMKEFVDLAKLH